VRPPPIDARRAFGLSAVALFVLLAAIGTWRSFDSVWTTVGQQRLAYSKLAPVERDDSAAQGLTDLRVFYFWAGRVHRGDRYYLNVNPVAAPVLSEIGGYYLIPSERSLDPKRATVILSLDRRPAAAGVRLAASVKVPVPGIDATFSRVVP
jgi:hypothetical protein